MQNPNSSSSTCASTSGSARSSASSKRNESSKTIRTVDVKEVPMPLEMDTQTQSPVKHESFDSPDADRDPDAFKGDFEVQVLRTHLQLCLHQETGHVNMDEYIEVFKQLYKFFCMLGTVFGFVGSDVKSKVEILMQYRLGSNKNDYETVEKMLDFEVSTGLVKTNKESSGARTLLRLHRSLIFVSQFLDKSLKIGDNEGTSQICKVAYDDTLAKYHPWLIKKGAHLAMYALPTKKDLFTKVCGVRVQSSEVDGVVKEVIQRTQAIYDRCEGLYKQQDLLSLP